MSEEFEPYLKKSNTDEFSSWDYKEKKNLEPEVSDEEKLRQECEALRKQANQEGYEQGMSQAQEELNSKRAELVQWISLLQKPVQLLDEQLTQEIIQTVIWLCQYCIGVELSVNPEKLRALLNEIKDELPTLQGNKVFAMNPDDVNWINTEMSSKEIPGLQEFLTADPSLERGDFYLKSEHSELDGRIYSRLVTVFSKYINKDNLISTIESQD